jgi:acylphosphatase
MEELDESRSAFRVKGRVQGVGFRYFTCGEARRLGIVGWVRNTSDGCVEGEAQGTSDRLDAFFVALRSGPPLSRVDALQCVQVPVTDRGTGFNVRY